MFYLKYFFLISIIAITGLFVFCLACLIVNLAVGSLGLKGEVSLWFGVAGGMVAFLFYSRSVGRFFIPFILAWPKSKIRQSKESI